MQHRRTKVVPETTREVVDRTTCDVCEKEIHGGLFSVDKIVVSRDVGTSCPEGGSSVSTSFDLCADCFTNKLVPFLASLGAKPRIEEHDW